LDFDDDSSNPFVVYKDEVFEKRTTNKWEVRRLPDDFGRNLDSVDKAYEWLVNPHNWFESTLDIVRWNGVIPTISKSRGELLARQPYDTGFPEVIMMLQRRHKAGKKEVINLGE
jgi:hypothetical protein